MKLSTSIILSTMFISTLVNAGNSEWDAPTSALPNPEKITVYRSPSCGCCGKWIDHMKQHGFSVTDIKIDDMNRLKREMGIPKQLESCHTALVNGVLVEGHVPAGDVKLALSQKDKPAGLAAAGMPAGSPGMEMGEKRDKFSIMSFDRSGASTSFSEH